MKNFFIMLNSHLKPQRHLKVLHYYLVGNKIKDKSTVSKSSLQFNSESETKASKEKYIFSEERQQNIHELRLI